MLKLKMLKLTSDFILFVGTFRATMIHALKAFKKDQEILLQAMKVFIQEPSMDWEEQSLKLRRHLNGDDQSESGDLFSYKNVIFNNFSIS